VLPTRRDDLLIEKLEDETIVYDPLRHRAYCLNRVSHLVLHYCDGRSSVAQIVANVQDEIGVAVSESVVWSALQKLSKAHLLQERLQVKSATKRLSRRDLGRKLVAGGVVAVVMSMAVPPSASAASGICGHSHGANCGCPPRFTCYVLFGICLCLPSNAGGPHCTGC
jgi:Coenzyme PQQ synthesis protein D (PqqD)